MSAKEKILSILPKRIKKWFLNREVKKIEASKEEKLKIICMSKGLEEEYETYQIHKRNALNDIVRLQGYIDRGIEPKRWKYELNNIQRSLEFIRPNNPKDIEYRDYWRVEFGKKLKEVAPEGLDLRFHGTSIHNTKAILESGGIFSSVDINDGYRASTDLSGEISVSTVDTVDRTLHGWFAGLGDYIRSMPSGCIFALKPRTQKDKELEKLSCMESVNFNNHPEQLYGIFTTDENIPNVKIWLENAGLSPELVTNFEGFLEKVRGIKSSSLDKYVIKDPNVLNRLDTAPKKNIVTNHNERDDFR